MFIATTKNYIGLSTDSKPDDAPVGSKFYTYDTRKNYFKITPHVSEYLLRESGDRLLIESSEKLILESTWVNN